MLYFLARWNSSFSFVLILSKYYSLIKCNNKDIPCIIMTILECLRAVLLVMRAALLTKRKKWHPEDYSHLFDDKKMTNLNFLLKLTTQKTSAYLVLVFSILLFTQAVHAQFKVIGYYPTYAGSYPTGINSIDLAKITHLNIAFANPNAAGNLIPDYGTTGV